MKTKILILAAFFCTMAIQAQTIADSLTYIVIDDGSTKISVNKADVKEVAFRAGSNDVTIYAHRNINLNAADYSKFTSGSDLNNWVVKSIWSDYDSISIIYDGTQVDSLKYYINGTLEYIEDYENDGTNIILIK